MAFENNQQDAFNLRNDTKSLQQWQSELDKATTAIGAAEVAAEEELAALKFKNLVALQDARVAKLEQLIALEDKGIRELAKARLTLSDRQFELRKKEIQKEFQLAKRAAEELLRIRNKKAKPIASKTKSATKDTTTATKAATKSKSAISTEKASGNTNNIELIGLVGSIDKNLGSLHDTVINYGKAKKSSGVQERDSGASSTKAGRVNSANMPIEASAKSVGAVNENTSVPPDRRTPVEAKPEEERSNRVYSDDASSLTKADIGHYSFEAIGIGFESLRKSLGGKENAQTRKDLNTVIKSKKPAPQDSIDAAGELLKHIEAANEAEQKLKEFNEASVLVKRLRAADEEHQLRQRHAEEAKRAAKEAEALTARSKDLEVNRQKYIDEARLALDNNFAKTQNSLAEEFIKAEEARAYTLAHKKELLDQEGDKLRNKHAAAAQQAELDKIAAAAAAEDLKNNEAIHFTEAYWAQQNAFAAEQNRLVEERIKTEAALAHTRANRDKLIAQEQQKLENEHSNSAFKAMQEHIALTAKADDLKNNKELYAHEEYRALNLAFLAEQNKLTATEIQAEAKLKFAKSNEGRLLDQAAHNLRIGHINAEHDAMQSLINAQAKADDLKNNRDKYLAEAEQALKVGHENKLNDLRQANINAEAKANDLAANRQQYAEEARQALENAFYEEQNKLVEDRIQAEEAIAFSQAHAEALMARELQQKRLSYLKEYQEHQKKAGKYAVSQEEFEKDKARKANKAAKKEAARGIIDGVQKFGTGEFSLTDIKKSYGEYMGQRTVDLNTFDKEKYIADLKAENPGLSDEDVEKAAAAEAKKAEASAKVSAQFELLAEVSGNLAQQLSQQTNKIGARQAPIDTRLQGSTANDKILGSYWKQLARDMNKIGAVNPYFKQEDFASNIEALVNKGISFDIKQRAFLMTIQEKIANTFEVADGTLLRLIRIQQQDTTAGRLGMESALNSFLNSMYETSEYLTDVAHSVRGSLEEMQALMEGAAATELEFQVQKWMGSLYSVGMSQDAVQSIAQTFGQIASGDVSGLTGSGAGNLLIMAANEAGMSIADILQDGLNADDTNKLMQAMVNYLAEIAETSSDSRVVQQQLANVYGVKASDLRAATNLASSIKDVSKQDLTYSGMLGQLNKMANIMAMRTSTGEMLTNVWDNFQYTMATQMANDPVLYLLPKIATLLEDSVGGIDLPFVNVMGFGVDLNTSVAQLMNVAAMSGSILGALGPMMSGLASAVSGSVMLSTAGINTSGKAPVIARGSAQPLQHLSGSSLSESGYIGNASGTDIKNATLQDAEDSKKQQMIKAKDEESSDDIVIRAQQAAVDIYNLLEEVAHGSQSLRVRIVNNSFGAAGPGSGSSGGGNYTIGDGSSVGSTGGMGGGSLANGVNGGADNGNWVLTF